MERLICRRCLWELVVAASEASYPEQAMPFSLKLQEDVSSHRQWSTLLSSQALMT
jgi:hypothetical protein